MGKKKAARKSGTKKRSTSTIASAKNTSGGGSRRPTSYSSQRHAQHSEFARMMKTVVLAGEGVSSPPTAAVAPAFVTPTNHSATAMDEVDEGSSSDKGVESGSDDEAASDGESAEGGHVTMHTDYLLHPPTVEPQAQNEDGGFRAAVLQSLQRSGKLEQDDSFLSRLGYICRSDLFRKLKFVHPHTLRTGGPVFLRVLQKLMIAESDRSAFFDREWSDWIHKAVRRFINEKRSACAQSIMKHMLLGKMNFLLLFVASCHFFDFSCLSPRSLSPYHVLPHHQMCGGGPTKNFNELRLRRPTPALLLLQTTHLPINPSQSL